MPIAKRPIFKHLFSLARDPVSSATHFWGAVLSAAGTAALLVRSLLMDQIRLFSVLSALIFGLSLVALYAASSIYHFYSGEPKIIRRLRKLDHAMIYVLIAGTYTPIAAAFLSFNKAMLFLSLLWGAAIIGIIVKLCWLNAPRVLSTLLYLAMGWAIVFDLDAFSAIPAACIAFILAGGVAYSVGAVIYMMKKPNFKKGWGFHELFHLFILLGSALHFAAVFIFALS